jgi:putative flippase GtrA
MSEQFHKAIFKRKITRFLIAGVGTAATFFVLSYLFVINGMPPFYGIALAYGVAFFIGYIGQRNWTFGAHHKHKKSLPRYLVLQLACGLTSGVLAQVSVEYLKLSAFLMSLVTTAAAGIVSYAASSAWVFPIDPDTELAE